MLSLTTCNSIYERVSRRPSLTTSKYSPSPFSTISYSLANFVWSLYLTTVSIPPVKKGHYLTLMFVTLKVESIRASSDFRAAVVILIIISIILNYKLLAFFDFKYMFGIDIAERYMK